MLDQKAGVFAESSCESIIAVQSVFLAGTKRHHNALCFSHLSFRKDIQLQNKFSFPSK